MDSLSEVERYLRATGIAPATFGRRVAKDPRLVFDLRRGREPGQRLRARIARHIGAATPSATRTAT